MARNKANLTNVDGSDLPNYPDKRIRDNDGSGNGTGVDEIVYGDIHEFFAKLMRLYGIAFNSLPDNVANGYQFVEAVKSLASKNDFILNLTVSGGKINVPLKLGFVTEGESFVCLSQFNKVAETQIEGTADLVPVLKNVTFKGGNFKTGEYVRLVVTAAGVDLIRLSDGAAFNIIAQEFNFLKAANQTQEDAGAINTVATTPLTNFTAFVERVNGGQSVNFLVTNLINGLMSKEDKIKLDGIGTKEKNYGTFAPADIHDASASVGLLVPVTGDVDQAIITQKTPQGEIYVITFANAMDNTTYQIQLDHESDNNVELDNDIAPPIWKKISTTQIEVYLEQTIGVVQDLIIHVTAIQR